MKTLNTPPSHLVTGEELLEQLFPNAEKRPSKRWLGYQKKRRAIPYIKWGGLVLFDPDQVREYLATKKTIKPL